MHHNESVYGEIAILAQELAGQQLRLATRPELPDYAAPAPALDLLATHIAATPAQRLLILGDELGTLASMLTRCGAEVQARVASLIGRDLNRRTMALNGLRWSLLADAVGVPADAAGYDIVAMIAPSQRDLARRWLLEAFSALKPGGQLYLAGANRAGIQPIIADTAALFGSAGQIANRARQRVAMAWRPGNLPCVPDWAQAAGIAPASWYEFVVDCRGQQLQIASRPGIFAYRQLDAGTAMLLDVLDVPPGAAVLDVGCGYGIIGVLAAKLGAGRVDLVDNSFAAVAAGRQTITRNRIAHARALAGDVLSTLAGQRYDLILSNPPFHSGKQTSYAVTRALISQARAALNPGGRMLLVANRFLPYEQELQAHFAEVTQLAGDERYRVLQARQALLMSTDKT
jgi:16S rRNA (guanine1207-N2)-methyltransferase